MKKREALCLAYESESAPYFCFAKDGSIFWRNSAAQTLQGETFFELFPWADDEKFFSRRSFSVTDPLRRQCLQITAFEEDGEPFYLAFLEEISVLSSEDDAALIRQFSATVRHHLNHLFLFLDSLSEKLEEGDEQVSSKIYGIRKSALAMLKSVYNWDARLLLQEQEIPFGDGKELFPLLRELIHSAAMLTVGGSLTIESNIAPDDVAAEFDTEVLQIAILNFISIALANASRKGAGRFSFGAEFKDGWVRLTLSDNVSSELTKGEFSMASSPFGGESYQQQAVSLMQQLVSFYKGQLLLTKNGDGYRMTVTLPGKVEHRLRTESEYSYRSPLQKSRFSLPEVMLSDYGQELF